MKNVEEECNVGATTGETNAVTGLNLLDVVAITTTLLRGKSAKSNARGCFLVRTYHNVTWTRKKVQKAMATCGNNAKALCVGVRREMEPQSEVLSLGSPLDSSVDHQDEMKM